jgi:hypothetical protein
VSNTPAGLKDALRALAQRYGTAAVVHACTEILEHLAMRGVAAAAAEKRADRLAQEQCPRCRRALAILGGIKQQLRPGYEAALAEEERRAAAGREQE